MFDIGFWEILLITLVGLVVIGPERLPAVARTLGLWTGRVRQTANRFRADLEQEFRAQELRALLEEEGAALREPLDAATSLRDDLRHAATSAAAVDQKQADNTQEPTQQGVARQAGDDR